MDEVTPVDAEFRNLLISELPGFFKFIESKPDALALLSADIKELGEETVLTKICQNFVFTAIKKSGYECTKEQADAHISALKENGRKYLHGIAFMGDKMQGHALLKPGYAISASVPLAEVFDAALDSNELNAVAAFDAAIRITGATPADLKGLLIDSGRIAPQELMAINEKYK